jgi:hypothetical protein
MPLTNLNVSLFIETIFKKILSSFISSTHAFSSFIMLSEELFMSHVGLTDILKRRNTKVFITDFVKDKDTI